MKESNELNKIMIAVLAVCLISFIITLVKFSSSFNKYNTYRKQYNSTMESMRNPLNQTKGLFTPEEIKSELKKIPDSISIKSIVELNDEDGKVSAVGKVKLDELEKVSPNSMLEISFKSDNNSQMLAYLSNLKFAYDYIDFTNDVLTIRVLLKGE